jgi:outer membrane lipoprotein SlyB
MNKTLAIAAVLMAAASTGIFSTTSSIAFAQDESETNTEQEIKQKNVCSGWAVCINTAENLIGGALFP